MQANGTYERIARYLSSQTRYRPEIAIICGSGLSNLSQNLENSETFTYESIPEFPSTTIDGHTGELVFGTMGSIQCCCFRGRFHFYEGNTMDQVILPVRVMALMGAKLLIVTNAAGGLNPDFNVGDIMIIQDHFGLVPLSGHNPLRGANSEVVGPRFPSLSDTYDDDMQAMVVEAGRTLGLHDKIRQDGTYCFVCGPSYETRAEARFLQSIGGDVVGASTCPESIAAKHSGMRVLGLSLITNKVVLSRNPDVKHASHAEVLQAVSESGSDIASILQAIITADQLGAYLSTVPSLPCCSKQTGLRVDSTGLVSLLKLQHPDKLAIEAKDDDQGRDREERKSKGYSNLSANYLVLLGLTAVGALLWRMKSKTLLSIYRLQ